MKRKMKADGLLEECFARQVSFQKRLGQYIEKPYFFSENHGPDGFISYLEPAALELVKVNADSLMMEAAELKDWTPWKHWSQRAGNKHPLAEDLGSPEHVEEMKIEVADAFCFLINCASALDMNASELAKYHEKKMGTNHERQNSDTY
jgi:hypothetical protein